MRDPKDILQFLYQNDRLAPFYIVRGPILDNQENMTAYLTDWALKTSANLLANHNQEEPQKALDHLKKGHSDFAFIHKEKENREYKLDEPGMVEFFKSQSYGPLSLKRKFIWVHEAEKISTIISNKWLKTLEEPLSGITTLFLVGNQKSLLKTIESRAITLRLKPQASLDSLTAQKTPHSFAQYLKEKLEQEGQEDLKEKAKKELLHYCQNPQHSHSFLLALKTQTDLKDLLFQWMLDFAVSAPLGATQQQHILNEVQWFQKASEYNNAPGERFFGLLKSLEEGPSLQA